MEFISYDCANKSMGVAYGTCDVEGHKLAIAKIFKSSVSPLEKIKQISVRVENLIKIKFLGVVELLPNQSLKSATENLRARRLKGFLSDFSYTANTIFIEDQTINKQSGIVSDQINYHYSDGDHGYELVGSTSSQRSGANPISTGPTIIKVRPTLKNSFAFTAELKHSEFVPHYEKLYTANKNHSKANTLWYLRRHGLLGMLKNIPKKNRDDVSDAFMMAYAWILREIFTSPLKIESV
jgi:hypothetical protein